MIFKMSDIDQTVTVYKLHPETNEFIGSDNAFILLKITVAKLYLIRKTLEGS